MIVLRIQFSRLEFCSLSLKMSLIFEFANTLLMWLYLSSNSNVLNGIYLSTEDKNVFYTIF